VHEGFVRFDLSRGNFARAHRLDRQFPKSSNGDGAHPTSAVGQGVVSTRVGVFQQQGLGDLQLEPDWRRDVVASVCSTVCTIAWPNCRAEQGQVHPPPFTGRAAGRLPRGVASPTPPIVHDQSSLGSGHELRRRYASYGWDGSSAKGSRGTILAVSRFRIGW